jgi:hypothetical protein
MKKTHIAASPVQPDKAVPPSCQEPSIDLAAAWTYAQETGELQQDGKHVSTGYSGASEGKNNPAMENVPNVGPIPRGDWTIAGPPVDSKDHGPYVLKLNPAPSTETHGRSGFLMHGGLQSPSRQRFPRMRHSAQSDAGRGLARRRPGFASGCRDSRVRKPQ